MTIRRTQLNTDSLCCVCFVHIRVCFQANPPFDHSSFSAAFVCCTSYVGWVHQWKPCRIPVGDSCKKPCGRVVFISGEPSDGPNTVDVPVLHNTDHSDCTPVTPRISKQFDSPPWEPTKPQDKASFGERIEAPLPPLQPRGAECNFIHPRQFSPFPERLELPFSNGEILKRS